MDWLARWIARNLAGPHAWRARGHADGRDASAVKAGEEGEPLVGRLPATRLTGSEDCHPRVRLKGVTSRGGYSVGERCQ